MAREPGGADVTRLSTIGETLLAILALPIIVPLYACKIAVAMWANRT